MSQVQRVPYYELPVYRTARQLYNKLSTNKTLESIPKAVKKRMVEPALSDMWDIMADIYEVREIEKQLEENGMGHPVPGHKEARELLLRSRRRAARCIIAIRTVHETRVSSSDLRALIPNSLYNEYSHDLVSIYRQLGFWARKHTL